MICKCGHPLDLHVDPLGDPGLCNPCFGDNPEGTNWCFCKDFKEREFTVEMPPQIAALPRDERRGLPIPFMNQREDGTHDFLAITASHVIACVRDKLCGICGQPLKFASAFVGGPLSTQNRRYSDPPFHPACAEFSMTVCPHIIISHARRATDERLARESGKVLTHETATMDKPQEWFIGIAPTAETTLHGDASGIVITSGRHTKRIRYYYDESGKIVRA